MRPPRPDIAIPPSPPGLDWIGSEPLVMERLAALGPVLVHFFEAAELAPVRTLPYLAAWHSRYGSSGLRVVGVHSPRYPFTSDSTALTPTLEALGLTYPVAVDSEHRLWLEYGCEGWPSLFLWGKGGALTHFHFGEGGYEETERAIRAALADDTPEADLPEEVGPLRDGDRPEAMIVAPTGEVRPGPGPEEPFEAGPDADTLKLDYRAGGAYAILEGQGTALLTIDDGPGVEIEVARPGLYELATHPHHEQHALKLTLEPGQRLWALQFSPGLAS